MLPTLLKCQIAIQLYLKMESEVMNTQNQGPAKRGPKPRPQTRNNLISAGMQMLHESGYAATGIKDIVDAAKVPKGSFYNYFESKELFGKEVVDQYFNNGLSDLYQILENSKDTAVGRLRVYFEARMQGFKDVGFVRGCLMANLSLEVADHSEVIRESLAIHFDTWSQLFEKCIEEAQHNKEIKNMLSASLLSQFILNAWEGALLRMRVTKDTAPMRDFIDVVFNSLLV